MSNWNKKHSFGSVTAENGKPWPSNKRAAPWLRPICNVFLGAGGGQRTAGTVLMQIRNSSFSLQPGEETGGTAALSLRFVAIINYRRSGQNTVTSHLQKAVVIQLQLYQ
ncbi:hypothetical protein [Pseudorhizobium endolithicum]|uniref:hypothetical protein n=1 Tax=Pseudorhizobium endolithicum TaxID=1191678 RepID=UPI00115AE287|nr:hypothetical protein [Pseudorhizobium endolithicum]